MDFPLNYLEVKLRPQAVRKLLKHVCLSFWRSEATEESHDFNKLQSRDSSANASE